MINLRIQPTEPKAPALTPRITVVGVGGAGGNAVGNMINSGLDGVEFLVCNTDAQALAGSRAPKKIQLGAAVTGGLGAGAKPEVGRQSAEESLEDLMKYIDGSNMVFITSGMGGGTGTGAAPVLARACKEAGILTVGVVTKPFHFEGTMRMKAAEDGIREMQQYVDTLIVIPNQNLFRIATEKTTFADAFKLADAVLQSAVRGVTDLMVMPGLVNLDFNDIKTTMTEMGKAMMGTGESSGDRRATLAAEAAINNPLLDDVTMKGAKGVIINIAGGDDMTLFEIDEACNRIREEVDVDANIIFGTSVDPNLNGSLRVTVLATGIETETDRKEREDEKNKRNTTARGFGVGAPRANDTRQAAVASAATARTYASAPMPEKVETAPAYIQGAAFIPPAAVEADLELETVQTVSYNRIVSGVSAPDYQEPVEQPVYMDEVEMAAAPVQPQYAPVAAPDLSIPVQPVYATAPARPVPHAEPALSLFQRITNRMRRTVEEAFDDRTDINDPFYAPGGQQAYAPRSANMAVSSQPIPASVRDPVEVARPVKSPSPQAELDLDIPAFLRRQAS